MLTARHDPYSLTEAERRPVDILVQTPVFGGKAWVIDRKGFFVLERCPGTLRTIACAHAGAGALEALDGVPNENGFFPDEHLVEPPSPADGASDEDIAAYVTARQRFDTRNGRPLYQAPSTVMGSWMLDAGFSHGLTIRHLSGHGSAAAIATVVWMPRPERRGNAGGATGGPPVTGQTHAMHTIGSGGGGGAFGPIPNTVGPPVTRP